MATYKTLEMKRKMLFSSCHFLMCLVLLIQAVGVVCPPAHTTAGQLTTGWRGRLVPAFLQFINILCQPVCRVFLNV